MPPDRFDATEAQTMVGINPDHVASPGLREQPIARIGDARYIPLGLKGARRLFYLPCLQRQAEPKTDPEGVCPPSGSTRFRSASCLYGVIHTHSRPNPRFPSGQKSCIHILEQTGRTGMSDKAYENAVSRRTELLRSIAEAEKSLSELRGELRDAETFIELWPMFPENHLLQDTSAQRRIGLRRRQQRFEIPRKRKSLPPPGRLFPTKPSLWLDRTYTNALSRAG